MPSLIAASVSANSYTLVTSQMNIGAYQGTLIARTFAYHIQRIKMRGDQIRDWPCNALALATTAVRSRHWYP